MTANAPAKDSKVFIYIAPFTVLSSAAWSFRTFMETNYFFQLNRTGHFEKGFVTIVEEADDPDFTNVTYVLVVKNGEAGWEPYEKVYRPLEDSFLEHCEMAIESKKLIPGEQKTGWVPTTWSAALLKPSSA